jgi:hypothetical protein
MDLFLRIFLLAVVLASAPLATSAEEKFNTVENRRGARPYFAVDSRGTPWLAHQGVDRALHVTTGAAGGLRGEIRVEGVTSTGGSVEFVGEEVLVVWRGKISDGRKFIYVNRAARNKLDFGNVTAVNTESDGLLPVKVTRSGERLFVTWVDERAKPKTVYMNYSLDGGCTFQKEDLCLAPGFSASVSALIRDREGYVFFFFGKNEANEETGIFCRRSSDGLNWSDIVKVAAVEEWAPFEVQAVTTGKAPIILWAGVKGLHYACQDQKGHWRGSVIEPTGEMDVNRFKAIKDSKGNIFVLAGYVKWQDKLQKSNIYVFKSTDGGVTWKQPVKVNHKPFDNTTAKWPDMFVTEKGKIVVVWQDHRLIRGNIYMNYSLDGGETWMAEDVNLDDEPGKHNDFFPFISGHGEKAYVLWPRYPDDVLASPTNFYFKEVRIP